MNANVIRNILKIAGVCALGMPFIACANMTGQPSGAASEVPGSAYSAAYGGPNVRGTNLPSGGQYNGPSYGHAYPQEPR